MHRFPGSNPMKIISRTLQYTCATLLLFVFIGSSSVIAQNRSHLQNIQKKVQSGKSFQLNEAERNALKQYVAKEELSSFTQFLKKNGDLNGNGRLDQAEKQFLTRVQNEARKSFQQVWNEVENGQAGLHNTEGRKANSVQNRDENGSKKGGDHLARALARASQMEQNASRANQGNSQQGPSSGSTGRTSNKHRGNSPVKQFARSLRQEFLSRQNQLRSMEKGPGMKNNPVNTFARSLRRKFLSRVARKTENALNGADVNNNGRIDNFEQKHLVQKGRQHMPSQAAGKRGNQRGKNQQKRQSARGQHASNNGEAQSGRTEGQSTGRNRGARGHRGQNGNGQVTRKNEQTRAGNPSAGRNENSGKREGPRSGRNGPNTRNPSDQGGKNAAGDTGKEKGGPPSGVPGGGAGSTDRNDGPPAGANGGGGGGRGGPPAGAGR